MRREDVQGFVRRDPLHSLQPWSVQRVRRQVALMELETQRFYSRAAQATTDAEMRQLLDDLAEAERRHEMASAALEPDRQPQGEKEEEARIARQLFVLQVIQPGLVGLMDGSVSTLAPLVRRRVCHHAHGVPTPGDLGHVPGRPGGVGWGRHQHGLRRGPFRRRQHDRPRPALLRGVVCAAMTFLRRDLSRPALPHPAFLAGHGHCLGRSGSRVVRHRLGPQSLHGKPFRDFRVPGGGGRRAGVPGRNPHRQLIAWRWVALAFRQC